MTEGAMGCTVWDEFGDAILARPALTLAAHLGAPWAIAAARAAGVAFPEADDFRRDEFFNPNPHRLKLTDEHLQTMFLVRCLAIWGWRPLVDLAVVCSELQVGTAAPLSGELRLARDAAAAAARAFQSRPNAANREDARLASARCLAHFLPFEEQPDSPTGQSVWNSLGASWFAAETAAQDFSFRPTDGLEPAQGNPIWGHRNSVWPQRAAEAAAEVAGHPAVRTRIRDDLIARARAAHEP